jgi:myosin heavy subunit
VTTWEKPTELQSEADQERQGEWYWIPDEQEAFVPAKKTGSSGGRTKFQTDKGRRIELRDNECKKLERLYWVQLNSKQSDLVMLDVMNEPLIMYSLKKRFEEEHQIYTDVGTILISCNPYKRLPLYTPTVLESYIKKGTRRMPPHVFNSADDAFRSLREWGRSQSIVISGESGAGKTECTKQCLQYLAEIAGSVSNNVEQKILQSNPVLEAFGNAKTVRNNNSSRFGKYVEIFFNNAGEICGAQNTNYLLEKSRVVLQNPGERNYHIFFQLLTGGDASTLREFRLTNANDYHYLMGDKRVADVDDSAEFDDLNKAFDELGVDAKQVNDVYRTVAGVLHIGNVAFSEMPNDSCEVNQRASGTAIADAAAVLQLNAERFCDVCTNRTVHAGRDKIKKPLTKAQADASRDALAKFIYEKMFDWLVERMNQSIGRGNGVDGQTIGILDIFGFEIFEQNAFEQLCINFTNEKLQQFFNSNTFKKEEEVYVFEAIRFDPVAYIDNQSVCDLIEKNIIPLVNNEIRVPKGSDQGFNMKLKNQCQSENIKEYRVVLQRPENFMVVHYAGGVEYESAGFLERNRDKLVEDAYELLGNSKLPFLSALFPTDRKRDNRSLGQKFCRQLNDLMGKLNATEPHYIRCVKSNPNKAPMQFHGTMSLQQLRFAGVFEAITIRKHGFPFRLTHRYAAARVCV